MKNLLQLLGNLCSWFNLSIISFCGILWYGKLPKVSFYHWTFNRSLYTTKDIYNDVNCQCISVTDVPTRVKQKIIENYIDSLFDNDKFRNNVASIDIPMFDGKDIMGSESIVNVLNKVKEEQL